MKDLIYKFRKIIKITIMCGTLLAMSSVVLFADSNSYTLIDKESDEIFEFEEIEFEEFIIIEDPEIPVGKFEINEEKLIESYLIGYPDGTFKPKNTISNAEAATVFIRVLDIFVEESTYNYANIDNDHWAFENINALVRENIIYMTEEKYEPNEPLIKEQLERIIKNIYKYLGADYVSVDKLIGEQFEIYSYDEITRSQFTHIIKAFIKTQESGEKEPTLDYIKKRNE